MDIGRQWGDRLRIWAEQFPKHYYIRRGELAAEYFTTMRRMGLEEAEGQEYAPAPAGTGWGRKWEYGWFRTSLTVPEELAGRRLVFTLGTAEEMLVWVNGAEAGSIDKKHRYITLTRSAKAGETYRVTAECYAGHGPRREDAGPVAWGEVTVPEPEEPQVTVGPSHFGVWNEELFQTAMDYMTLYSLVKKLPDRSLRAMKIIDGLKRFTYIADFELPEPELTASVVRAREVLKPLLMCKNGSTAPEFTVFGQSHIDLAWLWPVEETERKAARTYSNQLALMEEYPEYRFLMCEPPIIEWLRELYPNLYSRVLDGVKQGRFYPEGALWVECDTNIPGGESLIRQFLLGKRWFRDTLGVDARLAWMPDTFGFSGALPQIMAKCGVPYFATQKLTRQDPEAEPFPYNTFWWEGIDGSRVLAHSFKKNNAVFDSGDLVTRWEEDRVQREDIDGMLYPFGYGDGGGGPTREMLEVCRRCGDLEGAPRCRVESPVKYFQRQTDVTAAWCGELYLAWHRGTLTAQARTKRGIRRAEAALKQVEYQMSQKLLSGGEVPAGDRAELDRLWKLLLFNQFHDIAPGSSIARVHERAERELEEVREGCRGLVEKLIGGPGNLICNQLAWPRRVRGVTVPAQGCADIETIENMSENAIKPAKTDVDYLPDVCYYILRNGRLTCVIDREGQLVSVKPAGSHREYLSGPGNRLLLFRDVNTSYDAWELGRMYGRMPEDTGAVTSIAPVRDGHSAGIALERRFGRSLMRQLIRLEEDSGRVDFVTRIDWQERHRILKAAFPVNVHAREAIHEIQFGYIKRPTHGSRQSDRDMYEVSNQRYTALEDGGAGAAVLNDCKYGVNVIGSEIRLTLLRAPMVPAMDADRGTQEFTYSFCPFEGPFAMSDVLREAMELNEPPLMAAAGTVQRRIILPLDKNIIVDTIKPADTGRALTVRVYEAMGRATSAAFEVGQGIKRVALCDMLEDDPAEVSFEGLLRLNFGAFEIKTLLLYL